MVMNEAKHPIPVYDICSLNVAGNKQGTIIAEPFASYLSVHPNLHRAHRHSFYHIVLFTEGRGSHTIDFEQFPVQAGQVYFMVPGQVHSWDFKGVVDGYVINFSPELLGAFLSTPGYPDQFSFFAGIAAESVLRLKGNVFEEVKEIFERIIKEVKGGNVFARDIICSLLVQLFVIVSRNVAPALPANAPKQNVLVLHNFRKLLESYYTEKHLPKEYAAMLYITPNHLNALCRDLLGKSAGEVIRDRVLLEAKRLLINAGQNISEIGQHLGFTDNSHFSKFFKKNTKLTPEEFRKAAMQQKN